MNAALAARRALGTPPARRVLGVKEFLEWAFGREFARIETDPLARLAGAPPPAVGMEYVLLQRARLGGVRIDVSRGTSFPHEDAEIAAAVLENLPRELGGLRMALRIAELARAGITPDWMPGAVPRCVPREWRSCKHGERARTETVGVLEYRYRGRLTRHEIKACPVTFSPSPGQIASARAAYSEWRDALAEIRTYLQAHRFRDHEISDVLPPREPWRNNRLTATSLS